MKLLRKHESEMSQEDKERHASPRMYLNASFSSRSEEIIFVSERRQQSDGHIPIVKHHKLW